MGISNYLENVLLDTVFNGAADPFISVHTGDPGETGANEHTGGTYIRQQAAFGAAASGAVTNSADIEFLGIPAATITHIGVWEDETVGNFLWGGPLTGAQIINEGGDFIIPAGDLDVTLD